MTTEDAVTAQAVDSLHGTDDPRLRELLTALIRHLHAFASETRLTQREWEAAVALLPAPGQTSTATFSFAACSSASSVEGPIHFCGVTRDW